MTNQRERNSKRRKTSLKINPARWGESAAWVRLSHWAMQTFTHLQSWLLWHWRRFGPYTHPPFPPPLPPYCKSQVTQLNNSQALNLSKVYSTHAEHKKTRTHKHASICVLCDLHQVGCWCRCECVCVAKKWKFVCTPYKNWIKTI